MKTLYGVESLILWGEIFFFPAKSWVNWLILLFASLVSYPHFHNLCGLEATQNCWLCCGHALSYVSGPLVSIACSQDSRTTVQKGNSYVYGNLFCLDISPQSMVRRS
jgi:hypothetical protein